MYHESVIPLSDRVGWEETLKDIPHSFAHTWESCHAMYLTTHFETYLYTYEDGNARIACPICERQYKGFTDIVTPFGFPGFVGTGACPEFPARWKDFASGRGYICGYIGINPMVCDASYFDPSEVYEYNKIFVFDLNLPMETIYSNLMRDRKKQVRHCQKDYDKITLEKQELIDFFLDNYYGFMESRGASKTYHFSKETLLSLANGASTILFGIKENGKVVAAEVVVATPYIADSLFNICLEEGQKYSTSLVWFAMNMVKSQGILFYNLGGGENEYDSVAFFKKRFGTKEFPLKALKQVYNPEIYDALCRQSCNNSEDRSGYFPPFHLNHPITNPR